MISYTSGTGVPWPGRYPASSARSGFYGSAAASTCVRSRLGLAFGDRALSEPSVRSRASGVRPSCRTVETAYWLGLTTQNAVRTVYLTSGPDRLLQFGAHQVRLLHTLRWQ